MTKPEHTNEIREARRRASEHIKPSPVFVLVEPQMGENIGAAARAMLNFGASCLRLVRPRDGWPNAKAGATASGASVVIDSVTVFDTIDEAIADCNFVLATTARQRELALPVMDAKSAIAATGPIIMSGGRAAVLFGGERNGLSSEDTARANAILSVPVNPAFSSLNLAQAVCLVAYEWSNSQTLSMDFHANSSFPAPAQKELATHLIEYFFELLDRAGYFYPPEKAPLMRRNMRTALLRAEFTANEITSLHGALKAISKKPV
ncbi:MAG: RNA methyltransferase [Pseudomonadota bacterium]